MNSKIKLYITPIIIIIICSLVCSLVGFSIYKLYLQPVQEGLETRIKREDGKLVKRRKRKSKYDLDEGKYIREGISGPFSFLNGLIDAFKKLANVFTVVGKVFGWVGDVCKYLVWYISHIFENIAQAFLYIPRVFLWLGSYITGGLRFITNLNKCFGWYFLDMIGQVLYLPVKYLFWLSSMQSIEDMMWKYAEEIDCYVKKLTKYHIIHYPDSIQDRCYSFCPDEFPRFPSLDWSFNPPSLSGDLSI
jgi:hypothetical protein